jgi:hypothetical protein
MYYFSHPEPYDMRALDPIVVVLGVFAILKLLARIKGNVTEAAWPVAMAEEPRMLVKPAE